MEDEPAAAAAAAVSLAAMGWDEELEQGQEQQQQQQQRHGSFRIASGNEDGEERAGWLCWLGGTAPLHGHRESARKTALGTVRGTERRWTVPQGPSHYSCLVKRVTWLWPHYGLRK